MLSVRLNASLRTNRARVRNSITSVNNRRYSRQVEQLTALKCEKTIVNKKQYDRNLISGIGSLKFDTPFARQSTLIANHLKLQTVRNYANDCAPKKSNVFGELGDRQYEKFEMDEGEKREEKFLENEARLPRRHRLSPGGYANLIKSHIEKGKLNEALGVLDLAKTNRDPPTTYMYNLLLRAFAVVGDFKKCRSLYAKMKKRGLDCNAATYTNMINVCANYHHSETALDYLGQLRSEFAEKNVVLNETHYNAMIKAYGRHNKILEAFEIADEMRDKHLPTGEITFNSLLIGTISDKDDGLRHAIVVWHMMRRHFIKPTTTTYNLLLRAIRDTKLGNLKISDVLISQSPECKIMINDDASPNLLRTPPSVNSLAIAEMSRKNNDDKEIVETKDLPAKINDSSNEKSLAIAQTELFTVPLENLRKRNRLILFGGAMGILESMKRDGATPDAKTMTLLMELVPNSSSAEMGIIKTSRSMRLPLDLDFYNMLMKKRSLRRDYKGAKEILDDIQRCGLCPDIITWGILALGCTNSEEARDLIEGIEKTGHTLNVVIVGTLINIACRKIRFGYVLEMMELMVKHNIKPNWEMYATLDNFQTEMNEMIKSKKFTRTVNNPAFKAGFSKFKLRYPTWQKQMERKIVNDDKKKR